jgi:cobalt-zinc-cadmium efflux system membrane fusion protein
MMKNFFLLITLLAGISFSQEHAHEGCGGHGTEPAGVELKIATGGLIERQFTFPAEIKLNRNRYAAVSPRYAGTIRELRAEPGDAVKPGDVLAVLENRETLAVYNLTSPLAGTVISKNGSVGESTGEETVLFEIADLSSVWVEINIFPQYQQAVRKGAPVQLIAPDGRTAQTRIEYVSPLVSPETRTFKARCELSDSTGSFVPGSFVRAQIAVESVQADVRVEKDAIQTMKGESIVFIQDADGLEPRDVKVGLSDGTFVEIKAGLKPGEQYVARGAFGLKAELVISGTNPHAGCGH